MKNLRLNSLTLVREADHGFFGEVDLHWPMYFDIGSHRLKIGDNGLEGDRKKV